MKLRIEDNTLRLRLTSEEVAHFHQAGHLETVVTLGPSATDRLVYALQRDEHAVGSVPNISYTPGQLLVRLPAGLATTWATSDEVSLRGKVEVADNQVVHILVEKDLGCKH